MPFRTRPSPARKLDIRFPITTRHLCWLAPSRLRRLQRPLTYVDFGQIEWCLKASVVISQLAYDAGETPRAPANPGARACFVITEAPLRS
jgi:hypothetical protein